MITRKQYNDALDIVEAYQKQIFKQEKSIRNTGKTFVRDWNQLCNCSTRLKNILKIVKDEYIEDIDEELFLKLRNAGKGTLIEFNKLKSF